MRLRSLSLITLACLACVASAPFAADELRVRQAGEDWAGARDRINRDAGWRDWLQKETRSIESWMARERDREDYVAGWIHDLQEDTTGAFEADPSASGCDLHGATDAKRAACVALLRHRNIRMMHSAARLATLTGSQAAAQWAAAQLDMYARLHVRQEKPGMPVLFRQGLDEANAIPALADTIRLLRPTAGSGAAMHWCTDLMLPMAHGLMTAQQEAHNVAVWHSAAAAIAALECDDPDLLIQALQGEWSLVRLLETGTSADGYWLELSLGYQNYVVQAMHEALLAAGLRGKGDLLQATHARLTALLASPMRIQFRGDEGPTVNDSNKHPRIPDKDFLRLVRRTLPTSIGNAAARLEPGWESLLDPPGKGAELPAPPGEGGIEVAGLKSLMLRENGWQALLRAGQGERFHAHQDILGIELKYGDTWIFRNSVTPAYGSVLHRDYYKRALSHNTPLVNGLGVSNWFSRPADKESGERDIGAGFNAFHRGVGVRRHLHAEGPVFTDRLQFTSHDLSGNRYGAIYHTDCALSEMPPASDAAPLPDSTGYKYLQPVATWHSDDAWAARLTCGTQAFRLSVTGSGAFALSKLSAPALAPARRRTALLFDMGSEGDGWLELRLEAVPVVTARKKR